MATRARPRFGELVRRHRTAAALSQEELAERAGLSVRAISDLERGVHRAPRLESVRLLAEALGLAEDERAMLLSAARPEGGILASAGPERLSSLAVLPLPPTRLIGREGEVAALSGLLAQDDARLVTLTGPGGTGKTRLAQEVAAVVRDRYRDGVCFVDLSSLTEPALVMPTIAAALGVRELVGELLQESVGRSLRDLRLLLVLDNCEQVLGAAADIAALLAACPRFAVLATSREPLHIRAEREIAVEPLPLPDPGRLPPLAALAQVPAVALFVERAQATSAGFALTVDNAAAVAAICQRLDGLPLAIELAAARIKALPPAALLLRLEKRLPVLISGGRDLPTRQRTMRDAIAWSYDLLAPRVQAVFRRLAVFVGGFSLEAAERVAGGGRQKAGDVLEETPPASSDTFESIASLVASSLLQQEDGPGGEPRYLMLETVREYGRERLESAGEAAAAERAHAAYFVDFAESGYPHRKAPLDSVDRRYQHLLADHANIFLALANLADAGDASGVARLAGALAIYWGHRTYYREGRHWLEWALAHGDELPIAARCRAIGGLSLMLAHQGHAQQAEAMARSGLLLAEQIGDKELVALMLHRLGHAADSQQRWREAEALFGQALALWRELGARAEEAMVLNWLSGTAYGLGDHALAAARAEASLAQFRDVDHAFGAAAALTRLARLARDAGDDRRAANAHQETLRCCVGIGERWLIGDPLAGLARIAAAHGQPEVAAQLAGAVDAVTEAAGAVISDAMRDNCERAAALACAALGEERFAALRAAGGKLRLEEAAALAAAVAIPQIRSAQPAPRPTSSDTGVLSAREEEVLRLVAAGRTDREIADALFLSRRTVNAHVARILAKLDVHTRREAVSRGRELGLLANSDATAR